MAGRRKKKRQPPSESIESYKPELIFIESPLEAPKHWCTPVQAARNPFFAPAVSVDDESSGKWVSPQFETELPNDSSVVFGARRKRKTKKTSAKETFIQRTMAKNKNRLFEPLDFCIDNNKKETSVESFSKFSLGKSQRLKKKQSSKDTAQFLWEQEENHTPKCKPPAILAFDTPDDNVTIPAVLRRLRTRKYVRTEISNS